MPLQTRHGFTLIELSIVLVIIGLVVGGVLVGRDLIKAAEIRAAASQLQQFETSYNAFRLKYNCIIGDCPNATDFFGMNYIVAGNCPPSGGAGNGNGNGDGFIDQSSGSTSDGTWHCEPIQARQSLYLSGLLPTAHTTPCSSSTMYFKGINDSCAYFFKDDGVYSGTAPIKINGMHWANYTTANSGQINVGALSPVQARLIDEKLDDEKPATGKFRGMDAAPMSTGVVVANSCVTSGVYNLNEDYTCRSLYYFK
ncbi:MAG: prepilin-type N-terminal cleavage/methylation domain-containing protein [Pseudomonadota bacterium]